MARIVADQVAQFVLGVDRRGVIQAKRVERVEHGLIGQGAVTLGIEHARLAARQIRKTDGEVVDFINAFELVLHGRVEARLRIHHQLPGKDDVVGGEWLAVTPGHVLAQWHGDDEPPIAAVAAEADQ